MMEFFESVPGGMALIVLLIVILFVLNAVSENIEKRNGIKRPAPAQDHATNKRRGLFAGIRMSGISLEPRAEALMARLYPEDYPDYAQPLDEPVNRQTQHTPSPTPNDLSMSEGGIAGIDAAGTDTSIEEEDDTDRGYGGEDQEKPKNFTDKELLFMLRSGQFSKNRLVQLMGINRNKALEKLRELEEGASFQQSMTGDSNNNLPVRARGMIVQD